MTEDIVEEATAEDIEEAKNLLRAYGILLRDGEIDGEPAYIFSNEVRKATLEIYDLLVKTCEEDKSLPKQPLIGTLMMIVMGFCKEGFTITEMQAACTVLKPFAERLIIARDGKVIE